MSKKDSDNENLPSDLYFGRFLIIIFFIFSSYALYKEFDTKLIAALYGFTLIIFLITCIKPVILRPFNAAWYKLGHFMGLIVTPLVLGLIFYGLFTPAAFITRLRGRDILNMKKNIRVATYWVDRKNPELKPESFKKQF